MADFPDNPAAPWPAVPPAQTEAPQPRRWVWSAVEPPERRARLRELRTWVEWLRTYEGGKTPGRELAEADWTNTLHVFKLHM
ncbi:hypothetical protein ACFVZC_07600 [Streptomyces marokkonensis]|uniref:Uncharacterized protein n=1 Tax=Streptomyces marokkonensis TaxID=324855 RepID=A0ABW6Q250_9ACTN